MKIKLWMQKGITGLGWEYMYICYTKNTFIIITSHYNHYSGSPVQPFRVFRSSVPSPSKYLILGSTFYTHCNKKCIAMLGQARQTSKKEQVHL